MGYRELMRRKLLEEMYDKMSPEEKRMFVQLTIEDKDHTEIMNALGSLSKQVEKSRPSWLSNFGANIAGNAAFDGAMWLLNRLYKAIR